MVIMCIFLTAILIGALFVLIKNQHYLTYELIRLNEVDYAYEAGFRHGRWVWQHHYEDWLLNGTICYDETNPNYSPPSIPGHNVEVSLCPGSADPIRKYIICVSVDNEESCIEYD